ncbi:MAG: ATP-binding protein [Blastocatellia bacterium]
MFTVQARELIKELLESFAAVGNFPVAFYERDEEGGTILVAKANEEHFPAHCQKLWHVKDGKDRCGRDMIDRAAEGFQRQESRKILCHAGLTTEVLPVVIDGETVAVIQFGAYLDEETPKEDRLRAHELLMEKLQANPQMAERVRALLLDDGLHASIESRDLLRRLLSQVVERVVYRHLVDFDHDNRMRKHREFVEKSAYHDVQLRMQSALANAENHLEDLKDPSVKNWSLIDSARTVVKSIELASNVVFNLRRGEYLPGDYRFEHYDLRRILMDAISLAHPIAQQRNIVILEEIFPESLGIMVQVSQVHLQQAFNNLLHNAVKYSHRAREYGDRNVTVKGAYKNQGYRIRVCNYGVGILEEERELIFEPGYKGKLRENEYRTGSGHGLPLSKQIIERHQGTIEVASNPAGDSEKDPNCPYVTTFSIWLPLTQPTARQHPAHTKGTEDGEEDGRMD